MDYSHKVRVILLILLNFTSSMKDDLGMRRRILILASVLFVLAPMQNSYATYPKAGSACTKLNQKMSFGGKFFTCIKSGKKLVWSITALKPTKVEPSALPSITNAPTPTPTPTPTIIKTLTVPTNFVTRWNSDNFVMSFDFPVNFSDSKFDNTKIAFFEITLFLNDGYSKKFRVTPNGSNLQSYVLTYQANLQLFGNPQSSFSKVTLSTISINGDQSIPISANS